MGLTLIKPDLRVNFIRYRRPAFFLSLALITAGLISLLAQGGPRYGIDFAGGMIVQVKLQEAVEINDLKGALESAELPGLAVQRLGLEGDNEYLLRTSATDISSEAVRSATTQALTDNLGKEFEIQRLEMVGPKVGADLRSKALEALFYAVLLIAIYISGRFEQRWLIAGIMAGGMALGIYLLKLAAVPMGGLILAALAIALGLCWYLKLNFALGAVAALVHDVLITVGVFSILGKEFDLTVIAALLTIIGYSLNDTIIVFDRIRENIKALKKAPFAEIINTSISQTLSRTVLTSGTTLAVVLSLYLFGGGVIHDFAFALLIGVAIGTYSSIFVASPILLGFGKPELPEEKPAEPTPEPQAQV